MKLILAALAVVTLGLTACGTVAPGTLTVPPTPTASTLMSSDTMASHITDGFAPEALKVLVPNGYPDAVVSGVTTSCVTEAAGSTVNAAQYNCTAEYMVNAPMEGVEAVRFQSRVAASEDSTGSIEWHVITDSTSTIS